MKLVLLVGIAGFFGTILRYGCVKSIACVFPGFPWGTLVVNVIGAAIAGFCFTALPDMRNEFCPSSTICIPSPGITFFRERKFQ